jgi:hypothetical protein
MGRVWEREGGNPPKDSKDNKINLLYGKIGLIILR